MSGAASARSALLLVAHGTVDDLDELGAFATRIRRGHAAPPELVAELRRRYEAIGGRSPLNAINRALAAKVEGALGVATRFANRLAAPYIPDVIAGLVKDGVTRVASVPLAQYSASVYARAVDEAAKSAGVEARSAASWALEPGLLDGYVAAIEGALGAGDRAKTTVVLSAHSLPVAAIRAGDTYEREVRAAADAISAKVAGPRHVIAFQSQGLSTGPGGMEWLGPDLPSVIDDAKAHGAERVLLAPIGFLADHVEILYDLDIEARQWIEARGMTYARTASLNDGDAITNAIVRVARPLLDAGTT